MKQRMTKIWYYTQVYVLYEKNIYATHEYSKQTIRP